MPWTYDLTTDVGRTRLLIPDRIPDEAIFSDEELSTFLALEGGPKRAAALALETIAADEALVQKVIRTLDISTDGSKTAAALMARAESLREQAATEEGQSTGAFDWVATPAARSWP
jgi:Arc/MetJ family transcription regulator